MSSIQLLYTFDSVEAAVEFLQKSGGVEAVASAAGTPVAETPPKNKGGRPRKTPAEPTTASAPAAAVVQPAAATPAAGPATAYTQEAVRAKLQEVVSKAGSPKAARAIVEKYADSMSSLKATDYAAVVAECDKVLGVGDDDDFLK